MSRYLDMVDSPEHVKKLTPEQLVQLAEEIRQELITKSEQDRIVKHLRGRRRLRTRTPGDGRWTKAQRPLARVLLPIAGSTPHRR